MSSDKSINLIIACTGSVATIKLPIIINKLLTENVTGTSINVSLLRKGYCASVSILPFIIFTDQSYSNSECSKLL